MCEPRIVYPLRKENIRIINPEDY